MRCPYTAYTQFDKRVTGWVARHGVALLRVGLGAVFLWFGVLKLFPGLGQARGVAARTFDVLNNGMTPAGVGVPALALLECVIGVGLITNLFMRATLLLLFVQMLGAAAAICLSPGEVFAATPFTPTPEGQYLIKSIALSGAALVTGFMAVGGRVVANREDIRAPNTRARRSRVDRMRAPFPPEVLAFLLLGGAAVSSSVTGGCSESGRRSECAEAPRDARVLTRARSYAAGKAGADE